MQFWLKISICLSSMVHEGCWVNCPTRVGNLEASIDCRRESARWLQLSGNLTAVDRVCRVAVEDFVLSQDDKPKRHQSACEIWRETAFLFSSVHGIVHHDLQLKCFKRRRAHLLSEANRISRLTSLADKQPYRLQLILLLFSSKPSAE